MQWQCSFMLDYLNTCHYCCCSSSYYYYKCKDYNKTVTNKNAAGTLCKIIVTCLHRGSDVHEICAQVSDIACSHDGKYLFSVGGQDLTVNMWRINTPYVCICLPLQYWCQLYCSGLWKILLAGVLALNSRHKGSSAPSLGSPVMDEQKGVGDFWDCSQCFLFPSMIWHCWLGDGQAIKYLCHFTVVSYPEHVEKEDREGASTKAVQDLY